MKDIFMCLLLNLARHGKLIDVKYRKNECFSINLQNGNARYEIRVKQVGGDKGSFEQV